MDFNDEKELGEFLSEGEPPAPPEPEEPEEPEEEEPQEPPETPEEEEPVEAVEALTAREEALIAQFTESPESQGDSFDPATPPPVGWDTQEYHFLKEGDSIDDILADPAKFNAKMAELYNAALQRGAQLALEATYRNLPRTISTYARQQIETTNLVNDFYQQNKDLAQLKPAMAKIAQKIGTEHPEYTLAQLLSESAKTARTIFKSKSVSQKPKGTASPAFVQQKGGTNRVTRPKEGRTLEDEVMDLIR